MAHARCYALFPTAIGDCAIAWNKAGLTGVWLPEASRDALERRVRKRTPGALATAPHADLADLVKAIARLLAGEHVGFESARLDLEHTDEFDRRVYAVTRAIAAGEVLTYGAVATRVGAGASARAVGQSLGRNPWPIVVPCHRVVAAGIALGGFSAPGGTATKQRLLAIERARRPGAPDLFDSLRDDDAAVGLASGSEARPRH